MCRGTRRRSEYILTTLIELWLFFSYFFLLLDLIKVLDIIGHCLVIKMHNFPIVYGELNRKIGYKIKEWQIVCEYDKEHYVKSSEIVMQNQL